MTTVDPCNADILSISTLYIYAIASNVDPMPVM